MLKRITYLWRRGDLAVDEFRAHWRAPHGPIAAKYRGLVAYNQNDVMARPWAVEGACSAPDGVVELWFADEVPEPGVDHVVGPQLMQDEPNFMSGFTGYELQSDSISDPTTWKIWVRGRWRNGVCDDAALERLASRLGSAAGPRAIAQTNVVDPETELFTRDYLDVQSDPPRVLVIVDVGDNEPSPVVLDEIERIARGVDAPIVGTDGLVTREARVVSPEL
ncbi:EthD domain-containing protein [Saccharopolyspora sp. NPDC049426]|uniref:EthD domain-containing protein n=1 Tax=Saccharopolyspora sp. NPDC049426 TaxID=3155652 RepID=UPI00342FDAFE